jgi:hypothetical protein
MHHPPYRKAKTPSRPPLSNRGWACAAVLLALAPAGCIDKPHIINDSDGRYCEAQGFKRGSDGNANCAAKREAERIQNSETPVIEAPIPASIQTPKPPAHPGGVSQTVPVTVTQGITATVNFSFSVKPDCTPDGLAALRIDQQPAHGTAKISPREDYAAASQGDLPVVCRDKKIAGIALEYSPARDYVGPDLIEFETTTKIGKTAFKMPITVEALGSSQ